jgi:hypothetical protein
VVEVADWNGDGLIDLIAGALDGTVRVYLNDGAPEAPHLVGGLTVQDGGITLQVPTGRSSPSVFDLDGDGRKDLICGNTAGELLYYRNIGTDAAPVFGGHERLAHGAAAIDLADDPRSRPAVTDINGDGVAEILVGAADGLVRCYLLDRRAANHALFAVLGIAGDTALVQHVPAAFDALPAHPILWYAWDFGDGSAVYSGPGLSHAEPT